jgi:putative oxidoreductase
MNTDDNPLPAWTLLLATLFLQSGIGKAMALAGTAGFIASKGLPAPILLAGAAAVLEIAASLALIAGWRVRWAALALCAFTLLAGVLFHDFWTAAPDMAMAQSQAFFKNVGIAGGLLVLAAAGAGRITLDARRRADT